MKRTSVKSYAKLNLSLEITGEHQGYHRLDSLVASVDLFDTIQLTRRKDGLINVYMHGEDSENIPPEKNSAVKAGELFVKTFQTTGADIVIFKDIPQGGGLGGSSADAAGVLNGMAKLYGVDDRAKLKELADRLGSDTGYMLDGGFARMMGRGEKVTPLSVCPTLHLLLVCPDFSVSTAECYQAYDRLAGEQKNEGKGATQKCVDYLLNGRYADMGGVIFNSLYAPACVLQPQIQGIVEELRAFDAWGVGMTGSGSCVFALFENREFCAYAKSRLKGGHRAVIAKTVDPKERKKSLFANLKSPYYLSQEEIEEASENE